ncbi:Adenylate isopentenyltransferase [Vitis vinifera]|uniref:Adenylate isopentenyltransferase n=1 Tax=Vitis vinifera TaxID=29760 RepID=A0A438ELI2_VITVI|nr:Adenylate isopentenyltransferase [Vitis vinifera]
MESFEEAVKAIKDNTCHLAKKQIEKILRMRGAGWDLKRLDATEAFRVLLSSDSGKKSSEIWEKQSCDHVWAQRASNFGDAGLGRGRFALKKKESRSSTGEGCLVSTFEPRKKAIPPLVCVKVIAPLRLEESNHVNFQIKWQLEASRTDAAQELMPPGSNHSQ